MTEWSIDLGGAAARPGKSGTVRLTLASTRPHDPLRLTLCDQDAALHVELPMRAGPAVRCRARVIPQAVPVSQQHLHREFNHQRTNLVISGMVLLLALSGWIIGGEEGARWAVTGGIRGATDPWLSPAAMHRQFGARLLHPADMPAVFDVFHDICRRARLPSLPGLYYLPDPFGMNAYALGGPEASAIILTEGLLRGMTLGEVAGILAHEVGHIRNNDGWSMTLAAALHRATALTSMLALVRLQEGQEGRLSKPLAALLSSAPAIGHLLQLGLSRIREFDADAVALELVDDPQALVAALNKLERHHTGSTSLPPPPSEDPVIHYLRSHPATWQRIGTLLRLCE